MREALFILAIIAVLLGLTAIRYRRQIAGMIGLARALKDAKNAATGGRSPIGRNESASVQLTQCAKCGIWVPAGKAFASRDAVYCSTACQRSAG